MSVRTIRDRVLHQATREPAGKQALRAEAHERLKGKALEGRLATVQKIETWKRLTQPEGKPLAGGDLFESPPLAHTASDVPELLSLANLTRADGGLLEPTARQAFIDALPVLKDQGGLELTLLKRASELIGSADGLRLDSPQSPGFSGAAIFIVKQHDEPVMVAKVTPHDALLDEVSTQAMLRAGGFDNMPQVFAMAKLEKPTETGNVAVELMSFAKGENIAREAWWVAQKNAGKVPTDIFRRIGEATAGLHEVKTASRVDQSRVDGMTRGRMSPQAYASFMQGKSVTDTLTEVPSAVPTSQNLGVSGAEWLRRVMSVDGVRALGVLDFAQLEAQHRELATRFRNDPGPAAVSHGDFHQGQLSVGEGKVNMFDFELLAKNLNADGKPLLSAAYDHAAMLVNMQYFARYAGFSKADIQQVEDSYWKGYEQAGGIKPGEDQLDFFKLWRQTWVMSLFQSLPPVKEGGTDPVRVRAEMANTLADVSETIRQRLGK